MTLFRTGIVLLVWLLYPLCSSAQIIYRGTVTDKESGRPVQAASVFFSNTSYGATSRADGTYKLNIPAPGTYDMVVAAIGYETFTLHVTPATPDTIHVALQPKVKELEAIVLQSFEKDGWKKWGKTFKESFLGSTGNALDCEIVNYEDIRFRYDKDKRELIAIAYKPLIIENRALGYTIQYQMEQFSFNFRQGYLLYTGYPLFEEMKSSEKQEKKWARKREQVYWGSLMHFMRSLYEGRLTENSFKVRYMTLLPNVEKQRVKALYKLIKFTPDGKPVKASYDSVFYYNQIMKQADELELVNDTTVTADSIAYRIDVATVGLQFPEYLKVEYTEKKGPAFAEQLSASAQWRANPASNIKLMTNEPLRVNSNGAFYNPVNLVTSGYWSWSEKMSNMLPFDFKSGFRK